ncbi:hypothetical protein BGZ52_001896 [Haplosporangium bisporale]|nr:hypothetical protein BGZ52_001896 [Haplosporangium bisporale]KAI9240313.1 MAG: hypothetical protein BYD32DRAFT_408820 [Podila humilis]
MDKRNDTSNHGLTDYVLPSSSPWSKLPQECLERIVLHLDSDTATLVTLLRVSRACFFLAVPCLYRDPFKRLTDILARDTMQPIPHLVSQPAYIVPKVLKSGISENGAVWIDDEASRQFLDYKKRLEFDLPWEIKRREHQLLRTLFATILPELCERHPDISRYFHGILVARQRVDLDTKKAIQWTTDCYLSHLQVLDLQKVPSRGSKVFDLSFGDCFRPPIAHRGVLDYMQRGLLAKHPDTIRTLRIPAHRLKTFQLTHERIPRDRTRPSRTLRQQHLHAQQQALIQGNADSAIDSESNDRRNMSIHGQRLLDTTTRPYCFTFHMLSTLRRLEVYNMSENPADWMTLERVVSTIHYGCHRDTLRELSVQTQAMLPSKFYSTLALMDRLDTLELIVDAGTRGYECISKMGASQHQSLRVLKITHLQDFTTDENSFEDLARFKNLEELEVTTNKPNQFRWFAENKRRIEAATKKQAALQASLPLSPVSPNTPYQPFFFGSPDDMVPALKKLRHLTLKDTTHDSRSVVDHVCEAFGEQLESFSLVLSMYEPRPRHRALMFQHPFRCLRTLAIRGKALVQLEFETLPKYFPTVETLILRHYPYETHQYTSPDNDMVTEAIGKLTRLRTLHLEGVWYLSDKHLLAMVGQCLTLQQLGIHSTPQVTMGGIQKVATILVERANNGVPGFQSVDLRVGLFRLPPIVF